MVLAIWIRQRHGCKTSAARASQLQQAALLTRQIEEMGRCWYRRGDSSLFCIPPRLIPPRQIFYTIVLDRFLDIYSGSINRPIRGAQFERTALNKNHPARTQSTENTAKSAKTREKGQCWQKIWELYQPQSDNTSKDNQVKAVGVGCLDQRC